MIDSSAKFVWFPDANCGFAIGKLVDIGQTKVTVQPVAWPSASSLNYDLSPQFASPNYNNNNNNINNNNVKQRLEQALEFPYKSVYPCDQFKVSAGKVSPMPLDDVDDSCALIQLNEAALLENVRLRFQRDKIYTYVAHILIAVNPYFEIVGLHSADAIAKYQGKSLGTMAPHVFAIADKAYRDMKAFKQSQSIIISGESGAGKTESQKYVLRYLCLSGSQSGRLEKLILDANPILEAFGNAKTIRNNNSSRFGKFIEIHYGQKFTVKGGLFFHYLLEKSRICTQSNGERNYHIFYQLCACLPQSQWLELELDAPDKFNYLRLGCSRYFENSEQPKTIAGGPTNGAKVPIRNERKSAEHLKEGALLDRLIDDVKCFNDTDKALTNFGLDADQKFAIYSIVAAVLHLGNINFCDADLMDEQADGQSKLQQQHQQRGSGGSGGCQLAPGSEPALETTARLLGLDCDLLRQALVSRIMSTARAGNKGTVYMVQLSHQQAQAARDALAKAIYSKLFDYIICKIVNKSIPFESSSYYIGVLDVAGFEYFQHNNFEQFLINFCNEKLQQFFNERILKEEQNIYESEGLQLSRVEFVDNEDCIQLFEMKSSGIFDLLDEESRLPKPSARHFTQSVHAANKSHFRLALARTSKLKSHREIRDDEGFLVRHFAGAVCYETHSFIDKNNDALHASLKGLMLESSNRLVCELFAASQSVSDASSNRQNAGGQPAPASANFQLASAAALPTTGGAAHSNKLNFVSVATTFRCQLNDLMFKLRSTGSHFIRCIKPNSGMVAHKFEGAQSLSQLHCSGMDSVLRLMQQGYPSRVPFNDLHQAYRRYLPDEALKRLDARLFCRALVKALGLSDRDFCFGSSKLFFKAAKFAQFDQVVRTAEPEHMAALVGRLSQWLVRSRWRKLQYCALSAVKLSKKILYRRELIVRLQRNWRAALVQRKLKYRIQIAKAAVQVAANLREFEQIIKQQLKATGERENLERESCLLRTEVDRFASSLRKSVQAIVSPDLCPLPPKPSQEDETNKRQAQKHEQADVDDKASCERYLEMLRTKRDLLIRSIRDKIAKQRELDRLEQQVAEERIRREAEEFSRRREEELKRQRNELEVRRRLEAVEMNSHNGERGPRQLVDSATDPISLSHLHDEQEQRDYEIALRLAGDDGHQQQQQARGLAGFSAAANAAGALVNVRAPSEPAGSATNLTRYNLTKWKYSDLRDTINTSCDLELLEACKREFHRRLKVYHAWRALNSSPEKRRNWSLGGGCAPGERAPSSIMQAILKQASDETAPSNAEAGPQASLGRGAEQRYFRIPFLKQQSANAGAGQRGWWFAHFDGQWIARQLELHPNREPILLVAGQHDIDMCELSLNETRLSSKRGAEILEAEFEAEWRKHGGSAYRRRSG